MDQRRAGNISGEQKVILIEFVERNPKLSKGIFNVEFNHRKAQQLWSDVTEVLNSVPGARKNWKQWRKTWQDMKNKMKVLERDVRRNVRAKGGIATLINEESKMAAPSKKLKRSQQQINDLLTVSRSDCHIRETYYAKKLSLLERKVEAEERIASAKERQVMAQERLADATEIQCEAQTKIAIAANRIVSLLENKLL